MLPHFNKNNLAYEKNIECYLFLCMYIYIIAADLGQIYVLLAKYVVALKRKGNMKVASKNMFSQVVDEETYLHKLLFVFAVSI